MDAGYELERAFQRKNVPDPVEFEDFFPYESRGDGKMRGNNIRDGSAQGKGSFIRKVSCRICGFMTDINKNDHSGGSIDGNGAGGLITTATATWTLPNGTVAKENYGSQVYNVGSGCPLCFSKNSTSQRITYYGGNPWDRIQPLGF